MTRYLTCDGAAELLDGFVDGELPTADQVAVEAHLRWCRVCEARIEDMRLIADSLRLAGQRAAVAAPEAREAAAMQAAVLARIRAERDQALWVRVRDLFVDMRLLWPAIGATVAVLFCVTGATGVFTAATAEESPDSMAALIGLLANPGSDRNPLSLGAGLSAPRAIDTPLVLDSVVGGDDAVYALSAVVTREGRVANSELLLSERASVRRRDTAAVDDGDGAALLAALSKSRFEPAQSAGGSPVAVNMIWLVARTTVKGTLVVERRAVTPARLRPEPKPAQDQVPAVTEPPETAPPSPAA